MAYYDFLNILFAPLLKLPALLAVIILAFLVSTIIIVVTKYTTDQNLMKSLKEGMKEHQKRIKELRDNPAKAMEAQKKAMESNMKYMMLSLKPTMITFIPIILIFGWMSSIFAYESIKPNQEFNVYGIFDKNADGGAEIIVPEEIKVISGRNAQIKPDIVKGKSYDKTAMWTLKGSEGEHVLEISYNNEKQQHSVLITEEDKYLAPAKSFKGSISSIIIGYKKKVLVPMGFRDWLGWLGTYIWSSLIFTTLLRKAMKVY